MKAMGHGCPPIARFLGLRTVLKAGKIWKKAEVKEVIMAQIRVEVEGRSFIKDCV
jgi:hypothetical protein